MNPSITLTGADERTPIRDLCRLADMGAEIGILYTHDPEGRHRYPSLEWIIETAKSLESRDCVALHVCGGRGRFAFANGGILEDTILMHVRRIQVNGGVLPSELAAMCRLYPDHAIITQHTPYNAQLAALPIDNHVLLVDGSGGRGILPECWERPLTRKRVGFAGGLNAGNLAVKLPKIEAVATGDWWIDMEGGLRDTEDWFSIEKAMAVMEIFRSHSDIATASPSERPSCHEPP